MRLICYSLLFLILSNSCKLKKNYVYLSDNYSVSNEKTARFNITLSKGDILSISVNSIDIDAIKPFNLQIGERATPDGYTTGNAARDGYLIDEEGNINFPVIGRINLVNLSREEAIKLLTKKISDYVKDPIVNLRIINFKISVLGTVAHPGTFTIPNEKISIFEALGLAGDTKITGKRKNVKVIRAIGEEKKEILLDLTSKNIFESEAYYLKQNDIVYVEPNNAELFSGNLFRQTGSTIIAGMTLLLTTINIIYL
ncbi:MAG: polysaccharide biosynthesis/export family protein [Flavobacteriia bacterium]|nr:polysaccharide biosynthesis/export family protein [Flavobacteriia bacterium]